MKVTIWPNDHVIFVTHQTPYDDRAFLNLTWTVALLEQWTNQDGSTGTYWTPDDKDLIVIARIQDGRARIDTVRATDDYLYSLDDLNVACGLPFAWAEGINEPNPAVQSSIEREIDRLEADGIRPPETWEGVKQHMFEVMGRI